MKKSRPYFLRRLAVAATMLSLSIVIGCNEDEVTTERPPEGKGNLIVNNLTSDTVDVFVGGVQTSIVSAVDQSVVYLAPGLYRVVLDQADGVRNYREDVDILMGRNTILHVNYDPTNANVYSVVMEFD